MDTHCSLNSDRQGRETIFPHTPSCKEALWLQRNGREEQAAQAPEIPPPATSSAKAISGRLHAFAQVSSTAKRSESKPSSTQKSTVRPSSKATSSSAPSNRWTRRLSSS